jgi:hypothetical protein
VRGDHFSPDVRELIGTLAHHGSHVIGLAELLRNKRAAGRHKDLDDVEHLEPLLSRRTP